MLVVEIFMFLFQRVSYLTRQDNLKKTFLKGEHMKLGVKFAVFDGLYHLKTLHKRIMKN